MEKILIRGGQRLQGTVRIDGAKNAVLPIIAACLLVEGRCQLEDVPGLLDVDIINDVIRYLGAVVERNDDGNLEVDCSHVSCFEAPYQYVRRMRASFLVLGPLLARFGRARMSLPGGCAIGTRPIDLHLKGLAAMGAEIELGHGNIDARAKGLTGAKVYLDFPSVGATENMMMAASLAKGITVIENAAEEPEIVDLANFLNALGGRVSGAGTKIVRIEGVDELKGARHTVIPDRIEAGTFMVAAAATGGDVLVTNVIADHLKPVVAKLSEAGVKIDEEDDGLRVQSSGLLQAIDVKTLVYPGFPTDMQAQFMALLTMAQGTSVVTETVFENRFMHVNELKRMGADIMVEGHSAVVKGVSRLSGSSVKATDLRAGAALVIAALMAEGQTAISCIQHIDRGYQNLVEKLESLGADIRREKDSRTEKHSAGYLSYASAVTR